MLACRPQRPHHTNRRKCICIQLFADRNSLVSVLFSVRILFVLMSCPCVFLLEVMLQNEFLFYPDRKYMFIVEKKSLTEYFYSVKDGKSKSFPRCHLDLRMYTTFAPLRNTNISPATDVCPHVTEYSEIHLSFDCALSGPFDNLGLDPALSFPDSLCDASLPLSPLHRFKALFHLLGVYHFKAIVSMHYFNLFREIVEKFSQFSYLYFLFLFHANPPTPAPSEENASPNKPRTFAGSPVFAAFDPLVPLEADPSVCCLLPSL